jgi:hypothetical protein
LLLHLVDLRLLGGDLLLHGLLPRHIVRLLLGGGLLPGPALLLVMVDGARRPGDHGRADRGAHELSPDPPPSHAHLVPPCGYDDL